MSLCRNFERFFLFLLSYHTSGSSLLVFYILQIESECGYFNWMDVECEYWFTTVTAELVGAFHVFSKSHLDLRIIIACHSQLPWHEALPWTVCYYLLDGTYTCVKKFFNTTFQILRTRALSWPWSSFRLPWLCTLASLPPVLWLHQQMAVRVRGSANWSTQPR